MRRRKPWILLLMLVAALAVTVAACGSDESSSPEPAPAAPDPAPKPAPEPAPEPVPEPIVCEGSIGFIGPITGDAAFIGQEQLNWSRLAVDIFNEENGTNFVLVEGDSMIDPAEGSLVASQFVSDSSILATVGPAGSNVVEAASPILDGEMVFISGSATVNELTANTATFYRTVGLNAAQALTAGAFMVETLGATSVMVVDDQEAYSSGLSDDITVTLEALGVTVTRESVSQDATDFSALVSKIDQDIVYLPWQLANKAQVFADQMAEQGIGATIVGADGLDSGDFVVEGAYITRFAPDVNGFDDPAIVGVVQRYLDEYGEFATVFGPPSYTAAQIIADAIKFACDIGQQPTRESVIAALPATNLESSVIGRAITFQGTGDLANAGFFVWQHGADGLVFIG